MDKTVIFLGNGKSGGSISLKNRRVWTCNDWFTYRPRVCPERVYQIHDKAAFLAAAERMRIANGRYINWQLRYAEVPELVVIDDYGFDNQRLFDFDRAVKTHGIKFFGSSFSYCFADAIFERIEKVEFVGIDLYGVDYSHQIESMLTNIEAARSVGIEVVAEREEKWKRDIPMVDWSNVANYHPFGYGRKK